MCCARATIVTTLITMISTAALAQESVVADLVPAAARAQPAATDTAPARRNIVAIEGAYGHGVEINGSVPSNVSSLWVRWTHRTSARLAGGEPAWGFELMPVVRVSQEPTAYGAGGHFVYEHRFAPEMRVHPVFRAGAGMVFHNREVPTDETRYNFSLFAGAGVEVGLARGSWLTIDYRLHHLSNADTGNRNPGINAHTVGIGIGWAF